MYTAFFRGGYAYKYQLPYLSKLLQLTNLKVNKTTITQRHGATKYNDEK